MTAGEIGVLLALLGSSLVALLLVHVARREAADVRAQAIIDVAEVREATKQRDAESLVRLEEARASERHLNKLRSRTEDMAEKTDARAVEVERLTIDSAQERARLRATLLTELEAVAGLSQDEASTRLVEQMREQAVQDAAASVHRIEAAARRRADERARHIVATAVQRLAVPTSSAAAVTVLALPSEDMRGRIIGKEGRNIRTFEAVTGVNVLLEDDSESVQLSSFDPERREIAEVVMRLLMDDGRIHPQRIEAAYAHAFADAPARTVAAGHDAAERSGVQRLAPELVEAMGRLRLRSSYSQNVLEHSVESALVAAAMAAEIGADVELSRRAAFLHDIGKCLPAGSSGSHATVGARLVGRAGESAVVVNAVAAHHGEIEATSVEAVLVQAADACSAARPGARRDDLDRYVERMEQLEQLVSTHTGVKKVLAMASGHEVRVVVEPREISDAELPGLAAAIAGHIEKDLSYPGEVSVTVVRELRATATAG
ncbi:ribonucrease Y [Sanguibacter gelidistatuariae]|uniref:Ribonuclease Y n=1 Tax=Sanguibacter gelidistatuariae TaxID=1814289 RepID=A0A1G6NRL1_9MICO|nr:ribonuclease Y [Sanguibacter gelidistatuariae]SDC70620.1 ribonucrease Y [Sanguibacter gelidistatuariae]